MKITLQWKDPDAALLDVKDGDFPDMKKILRRGNHYELPDEIRKKLRKCGFGEYLVVEFDLETMEGKVVK